MWMGEAVSADSSIVGNVPLLTALSEIVGSRSANSSSPDESY